MFKIMLMAVLLARWAATRPRLPKMRNSTMRGSVWPRPVRPRSSV